MRDDTLLRLRATDAGFDRELTPEGDWLRFVAAGNLAILWLASDGRTHVAAAAPAAVTSEVGDLPGVAPWAGDLPVGAYAGWVAHGDAALDALCRRIAVLGYVLPDQPYDRFLRQVEQELSHPSPDRETERVAEVKQRVGQAQFREALLSYWGGRCPISGVTEPLLLRASHAKPWSEATDAERLDVHNGLLLAAHLDAAFDTGLISLSSGGEVIVTSALPLREREVLGLLGGGDKVPVTSAHQAYLEWHRRYRFRGAT